MIMISLLRRQGQGSRSMLTGDPPAIVAEVEHKRTPHGDDGSEVLER